MFNLQDRINKLFNPAIPIQIFRNQAWSRLSRAPRERRMQEMDRGPVKKKSLSRRRGIAKIYRLVKKEIFLSVILLIECNKISRCLRRKKVAESAHCLGCEVKKANSQTHHLIQRQITIWEEVNWIKVWTIKWRVNRLLDLISIISIWKTSSYVWVTFRLLILIKVDNSNSSNKNWRRV